MVCMVCKIKYNGLYMVCSMVCMVSICFTHVPEQMSVVYVIIPIGLCMACGRHMWWCRECEQTCQGLAPAPAIPWVGRPPFLGCSPAIPWVGCLPFLGLVARFPNPGSPDSLPQSTRRTISKDVSMRMCYKYRCYTWSSLEEPRGVHTRLFKITCKSHTNHTNHCTNHIQTIEHYYTNHTNH